MSLNYISGVNIGHEGVAISDNSEIQFVLSLIEKKMFVALDMALDIVGMDEMLNGDLFRYYVELQREGSLVPLIVARLASKRDFEEVVKAYMALYETWPNTRRRDKQMPSLMKMISYLREQVTPID